MQQWLKDYYAGGFRVVIDGVPRRMNHKPTRHEISVLSGQSDTKFLRECESQRHAETTYGPTQDGIFSKSGPASKSSVVWFYILNGKQSPITFGSFDKAKDAYEQHKKAKAA